MRSADVSTDTLVLKSRKTSDYNKRNNDHTNTFDKKLLIMSVTVLYTTGIHQELITFANLAEKDLWDAEVLGIKSDSSAVFQRKEAEGMTSAVRRLLQQWMDRVKAFKERFGEERTPQDIKWALNSAEEALDMPTTAWENPPDATLFEN